MKFTKEQQMEIAKYAVDNNKSYKLTGEKYGVSYQQVAAWVRKYNQATNTKAQKTTKKPETKTSTLDILSRKDPILEKQLEDVKRRLGLIK
jgi:hypothetical protein